MCWCGSAAEFHPPRLPTSHPLIRGQPRHSVRSFLPKGTKDLLNANYRFIDDAFPSQLGKRGRHRRCQGRSQSEFTTQWWTGDIPAAVGCWFNASKAGLVCPSLGVPCDCRPNRWGSELPLDTSCLLFVILKLYISPGPRQLPARLSRSSRASSPSPPRSSESLSLTTLALAAES